MPDPIDDSAALSEYADTLRGLIESSGMLLDADQWQQQMGNGNQGRAAFELTSGKFQEQFITLWELFDERQKFNDFIAMLAAKMREIRRKTPFSALVTSTETSKHIVEHVHASIEDDRDRVMIHYLGHYPFLNFENRGLLDFKGEQVLIVTDVMATGTLVGRMAEIVKEVGGTVKGGRCHVPPLARGS